jgi:hypothetical protein
MTLAAEHTAALARLDADLAIAAGAATGDAAHLHLLRRRVVAAYRSALYAAGMPADPRWDILAVCVSDFIARLTSTSRSADAASALRRLKLLRLELLPEALEHRGIAPGELRVAQA